MSWANLKGFNFRATLGFVTDGANELFVNEAFGAYPQSKTIDGDTFDCGWETAPAGGNSRDRNAGVDARLAGIVFTNTAAGVDPIFRIDLPSAGDYAIRLAMGDATGTNNQKCEIRDTTTALITLGESATSAEQFYDASLALRSSAANWVSFQVEVTKTFTTTIFRLVLQRPAANAATLAHFAIKQISGGGGSVDKGTVLRRSYRPRPFAPGIAR